MTRRLVLSLLACLPLSWQVKLGAAPQPVPTLHAERFMAARYIWLHTTFEGQGSILAYLRTQYNAACRGRLLPLPKEIILGPKAFDRYEQEWAEAKPFLKSDPPLGASVYAFKGTPVFPLHGVAWDDWHVAMLAYANVRPAPFAEPPQECEPNPLDPRCGRHIHHSDLPKCRCGRTWSKIYRNEAL